MTKKEIDTFANDDASRPGLREEVRARSYSLSPRAQPPPSPLLSVNRTTLEIEHNTSRSMSRISEMLSQPPLAAGTVSGCAQYFAHSLPAVVEQPHPHEATSWQSQFSCEAVAARVGVDVESLMKWNPSLASDACVLQPDLNYCIVKIDRSEKRKQNPTASLYGH